MNQHYINILLLSCLFSYLVGSIPFGLILGKAFGEGDIRKIGSGNIGATNMLRTGRKGLAAATLALDFAKGIVGVCLAQATCDTLYAHNAGDFIIPPDITCYAAVTAVCGHVFPVWLKFRGGKGVATTLGVFMATDPAIGMVTVIGWLVIFYLTRVSSLAALGSIICAPILGYLYSGIRFAAMAFIIAVIVVYKHKDNIQRLREGSESKIGKARDPS
jgi:glycerol-3-phosphate acyltransferase PlsY